MELMEQLAYLREDIEKNPIEVINNSSLDIILKVDLQGNLRGFEIFLAVGGPNIILDENGLHGYWGDKEAFLEIKKEVIKEIWDYLEEIKGF